MVLHFLDHVFEVAVLFHEYLVSAVGQKEDWKVFNCVEKFFLAVEYCLFRDVGSFFTWFEEWREVCLFVYVSSSQRAEWNHGLPIVFHCC